MSKTYRGFKGRVAKRCSISGKTSFKSTVAARAFVATRDTWRGTLARVYQCPSCAWYHLTSQPTLWESRRNAAGAA